MRFTPGKISRSSWTRLGASGALVLLIPVRMPPGRARLVSAQIEDEVPAFFVAEFAQPLGQKAHTRAAAGRGGVQNAHHGQAPRRLGAQRKRGARQRPGHGVGGKLPAVRHSITSSARSSSAAGTVSPSACATLRLITSLKPVGCSTGRSAGLLPLSTRAV